MQSACSKRLLSHAGDTLEPGVFNPRRIIVFDPSIEGGEAAALSRVLETIRLLEHNESFRAAWFAEPALLPTADAWATNWCETAAALLRSALTRKGIVV